MTDVHDMRRNYAKEALDEADVYGSPIAFFKRWFDEACASGEDEVNAMVLSTVSAQGRPRARAVLLKELRPTGEFVFFTNFESDKGRELTQNPFAALTFVWLELERQVRIEGVVRRIPAADADEYFATRPRESQLGAWASDQSEVIPNRATLEQRFRENQARFEGREVSRPEYWGGFAVEPEYIEFWQGRPGRMHDRLCFDRREGGDWKLTRRMP